MNWDELKQVIGKQAKDMIAVDRGQVQVNGKVRCFMTEHKSDPVLDWLEDGLRYFCHNCSECYDIIDHAKYLARGDLADAYKILCEFANVDPSSQHERPKAEYTSVPFTEDIAEPEPEPEVVELEVVEPVSRVLSKEARDYMVETREISLETLKQYHVTGTQEGVCLNFVYRGKLRKVKVRRIGNIANKKEKYNLTQAGGSNVLYGEHLYSGQENLVICEGEIDALSCHEAVKSMGLDAQILSSSVPSGSSSIGWIDTCADFIRKFKHVILIPDADAAGQSMLKKVGDKLMRMVMVKHVDLRKHKCNDVNDMLRKRGVSEICAAIGSCDDYLPEFSVNLKSMPAKEDDLGSSATGFYNIDYTLDGLRNKQLTLLVGRSFHGKTTLARQILAFNVQNQNRVAALMGEEDKFLFRRVFLNQIFRGDFKMFNYETTRFGNRLYYPTDEALMIFNRDHAKFIGLFDNKHLGAKDKIARLIEWIKFENTIYGTTLFLIDNLSKLTTGAGDNLNQLQGDITNMLKDLCTQMAIHIVIIVHTKKHVEYLDGEAISGSGNIFNFADNCAIFERIDLIKNNDAKADKLRKQVDPDGMYNENFTSMLTIEKNRNMGKIGSFAMRYNADSNTLHDLFPESINYGWTLCGREYTPKEDM